MGNINNLFGGEFTPPPPRPSGPSAAPHEQLIDAIANAGYTPPKEIIFDGKIHRFSTDGRAKKDDGWYVAYDGKIHAGAFGSWRDSSTHNWRADIGREYTTTEQMEYAQRMREMRRQREEETAKRKASAAESCEQIWSGAGYAPEDHPYLSSKRVSSHGLKVTGDGRLIVPMLSPDGEIASLQYIPADGKNKRYHGGGRKDGVFYCLNGGTDTICVAEGYATASSIFEATGHTTYVSFDAGNLAAVAEMVRQYHADADIVIVADNDSSQAGETHAAAAAKACQGRYVMPPETDTDANDYANSGGDIDALIAPKAPPIDWLIPADDFAAQPSPIRWLIKGYLQRDALIMVHGPSGGGKTFMVLDMCLHLAAGKTDWHGNTAKPGAAVYLAGEGHHGLRSRVAGWKQHNKAGHLDMWLSKAGTDLNTPDGYAMTTAALDSLPHPPALIVVDTLHRFLLGDENSAQDAKTMLDACNALQERYGASVLLVHHTGVSEDAQHRARGSSAWRGALDIELSVVAATEATPMMMVQRKSKDSELAAPIAASLTPVFIDGWFDEDGEQVSTAIITPCDTPTASSNPKSDKLKRDFMKAWEASGKEMVGDCEYVSRSALKEWLTQSTGKADRTIRNDLDKSRDNSMIGILVSEEIIREAASGWILLKDGHHAAEKLLQKMGLE